MNAQHSSKSNDHYTPREIVDAARRTMGGIDLDPASCRLANTLVQAKEFYAQEMNGLSRPWQGKVFLNPPGGKVGKEPSARVWWNYLLDEWWAGLIEQAVFVAFSLEFLQTGQASRCSPLFFPFCIPSKRLKFWTPSPGNTELLPGNSPTHANAIIYVPPRNGKERVEGITRFSETFSTIGGIVIPRPF